MSRLGYLLANGLNVAAFVTLVKGDLVLGLVFLAISLLLLAKGD